MPEDGYQGDYVAELAARDPRRRRARRRGARPREASSADHGAASGRRSSATACDFDTWFLERSAARRRSQRRRRARSRGSSEQGHAYESEGALWLRTTDVRRRQGPRARALERRADLLRRRRRLPRGQARARLRPPDQRARRRPPRLRRAHEGRRWRRSAPTRDRLEIPILQFVHVVEGGEQASMSKRRGDFVTLDELIDEIGVDATRWFMLSRSHDSTIDLDLELARASRRREPGLLRAVRARADRLDPAQGGRRAGRGGAGARPAGARARRRRARADQEAARVPGRGRRGGRAARAAPDRRLRARARAGVRGVLPRLPVLEGPDALRCRPSGSACASRATKRSSPRSLGLLGVSAPESM